MIRYTTQNRHRSKLEQPIICSLGAMSRGVVVGFAQCGGALEGNGMLDIYELDAKNELQFRGNYKLNDGHVYSLHNISVSPDDSNSIITVAKCKRVS